MRTTSFYGAPAQLSSKPALQFGNREIAVRIQHNYKVQQQEAAASEQQAARSEFSSRKFQVSAESLTPQEFLSTIHVLCSRGRCFTSSLTELGFSSNDIDLAVRAGYINEEFGDIGDSDSVSVTQAGREFAGIPEPEPLLKQIVQGFQRLFTPQ